MILYRSEWHDENQGASNEVHVRYHKTRALAIEHVKEKRTGDDGQNDDLIKGRVKRFEIDGAAVRGAIIDALNGDGEIPARANVVWSTEKIHLNDDSIKIGG